MDLIDFVEKYAKVIFILNFLLLVIFGGYLLYKKVTMGYIFEKDISIKGGVLITMQRYNIDLERLQEILSREFGNIKVYGSKDFIFVEGAKINVTKFINLMNKEFNLSISLEDIEVKEYDPYFGELIFQEFSKLIIIALILIVFIIFLRMRNWISSLAILLTILFDLLATSFVLAITGFEISAIAFIAFLMILGYAIDNNIVLATNIFKETGNFKEKVKLSLKIGYMMELTTLIVMIILLVFIKAQVIRELAFILSIALIFDAYFYLFGNVPLYRLFLKD